jgi:hypothetical protein
MGGLTGRGLVQFIQHAHAISVQNVLRVRVPITLKIVTAALLFHLAFGAAGSAEELNIGHLETGDDTGINWLNFHCNQNSGSLTCDVFQTLIMHKVEPAEREKEINKKMAGDVVQEFKRAFADPCKNIDQLLELVRKSVATGVGRDGRNLNPRQAQEAKLFFESMADTCKNSNQGTIKHFIEIGVDKDIHTCRVINNYSPMKFSFDTTTQM